MAYGYLGNPYKEQKTLSDYMKEDKEFAQKTRASDQQSRLSDQMGQMNQSKLQDAQKQSDIKEAVMRLKMSTPERWATSDRLWAIQKGYGDEQTLPQQLDENWKQNTVSALEGYLGQDNAITPYQRESLDLMKQRLDQSAKPTWTTESDPKLGTIQRNEVTGEIKPLRTPKDIAEQDKMAQGKQDFEDTLSNIAKKYKELKDNGGISSTKDSGMSNLVTSAQTSDFGQYVGKKLGTENQSDRNFIEGQLPLLTQAIKEATGMSAQQMNSNVELQTFLKALGKTDNDFESNMEIIGNLSKLYGTGEVADFLANPKGGLSTGPVTNGKLNYADPKVQQAFDAGYNEQEIIQYFGSQ